MTTAELSAEIRENADRWLDASSTLLAVHCFAQGAEMVCLAWEATAGYLVGSTARTPSKGSVLKFAERYMPDLGRTRLEGMAFAGIPPRAVDTCAEVLYECYRGGLFHDGQRTAGVRVMDHKGKWMVSFEADGSLRLNAIPFQAQFERGLAAYLRDLKRDPALAALAEHRSAHLAKPVVVPFAQS